MKPRQVFEQARERALALLALGYPDEAAAALDGHPAGELGPVIDLEARRYGEARSHAEALHVARLAAGRTRADATEYALLAALLRTGEMAEAATASRRLLADTPEDRLLTAVTTALGVARAVTVTPSDEERAELDAVTRAIGTQWHEDHRRQYAPVSIAWAYVSGGGDAGREALVRARAEAPGDTRLTMLEAAFEDGSAADVDDACVAAARNVAIGVVDSQIPGRVSDETMADHAHSWLRVPFLGAATFAATISGALLALPGVVGAAFGVGLAVVAMIVMGVYAALVIPRESTWGGDLRRVDARLGRATTLVCGGLAVLFLPVFVDAFSGGVGGLPVAIASIACAVLGVGAVTGGRLLIAAALAALTRRHAATAPVAVGHHAPTYPDDAWARAFAAAGTFGAAVGSGFVMFACVLLHVLLFPLSYALIGGGCAMAAAAVLALRNATRTSAPAHINEPERPIAIIDLLLALGSLAVGLIGVIQVFG